MSINLPSDLPEKLRWSSFILATNYYLVKRNSIKFRPDTSILSLHC